MLIEPIRRADWRHDVHAYECYTCQFRSKPPKSTKECQGCINRPTKPHWRPHADYNAEAQRVILLASGNVRANRPTEEK